MAALVAARGRSRENRDDDVRVAATTGGLVRPMPGRG